MKKLYPVIAALVMAAMSVPACTPKTPDCSLPEVFCVGLVTDVGTIDDKSFNQSAWEGVRQSETDGVAGWVEFIETADAKDYDGNIAAFADAGYDVIVTVGSALGDATRAAAAAYPNTYFIGVDQFQADTIANVAGLNFPEGRAGFLVGALAAMMTATDKIGAVCGTDADPSTWRYGEGYRAGAQYINPDIEVFVVYHSDVGFDQAFADPEWGAATADSMIDNGADVIFGAGGKTGSGAVTAAAQRGVYVIGANTDQYYSLPNAAPMLLSSAIKLISPGVAELILAAGDAQSGAGIFPAGNFMGDAGYAPYHDLEDRVPDDVRTRMAGISSMLLNGELTPDVSPFKP
ncbi:MAG: membrane protein [Anaerolineaceae bacterium]|nr:MAG: membrane protein [Anaerolineaceae bacterium]